MNFNIHGDSVTYVKSINSKIIRWNLNEIYYKDSADFKKKNLDFFGNTGFIFRNYKIDNHRTLTYHLDSIFSRDDIDFFKTQIRGIRDKDFWEEPFANTVFAYDDELDETNHTPTVITYYSIPLFSVDRKRVMIINAFFCGLLCGGGSYNVYQVNESGKWVLIRKMNSWGE